MTRNVTTNTPELIAKAANDLVTRVTALIARVDAIIATGAAATTGTAVGTNTSPELANLKAEVNAFVEGSVY